MAVLVKITRRFGDRLTQSTSEVEEGRSKFRDLLKRKYILRIFLLYLIVIIVYHFIDFRFLDSARMRYQNQDELARFFDLFFGVAQGITLLLTFVTGHVISKFGVRIGMRIRPLLLTLCTAVLIIPSLGFGPVGMLFWMALITKLVDLVFFRATSGPAFHVLYQPIDTKHRLSTQVAVESMVGPIAGGLAGGVLLLLHAFGSAGIAYIPFAILVLLFGWIAASARVYREYRRTLAEALRGRSLEGGDLSLIEEGFLVDILKAKLDGPHPGEIIYALDLLERKESEPIEPLLIDLLDHPSPEVRENVLSRVQRLEVALAFPAVKELVETDNVPRVRAASLRTFCGLGEAEVVEDVAAFLDHPNAEIKLGAMEGLLHSGGIDGVLLAGQYLIDFENAKDPEERIFAARVLGEVRISSFYRPLIQLL
jgi:AAA family ATP:ADP antiporter